MKIKSQKHISRETLLNTYSISSGVSVEDVLTQCLYIKARENAIFIEQKQKYIPFNVILYLGFDPEDDAQKDSGQIPAGQDVWPHDCTYITL